jgi:ferritin-like metal-binding protein YciE
MADITTLQELYIDELKDLWSANHQMAKALKKIAKEATDSKLKDMLEDSQDGISSTPPVEAALRGLNEFLR